MYLIFLNVLESCCGNVIRGTWVHVPSPRHLILIELGLNSYQVLFYCRNYSWNFNVNYIFKKTRITMYDLHVTKDF